MKFVVIFFIVVAIYASKNSALFCYTCSNKEQNQCMSSENLPTQDCPELKPQEKVVATIPICTATVIYYPNETKFYNRQCQKSITSGTDFCTDFKKQYSKKSECMSCKKDFCNGSNETIAKFWIFLIAIIIVMYIKHHAFSPGY